MHLSLHVIVVVSLLFGQPAAGEPGRAKKSDTPHGSKSPAGKPAQLNAIVQPADSIPPPDQLPDCIFAASPPNVVDGMLKLADVRPGEVVFDLGCGDGRICIAAAKKYRARAYGYDLDAERVKESLENVKKNKVENLVTIERRDIFKLDLLGADVITLWLAPHLNTYLIPQLDEMKPGSRIVSFQFDMCGIIQPERVIDVEVTQGWKDVLYLWNTPLKKDEKAFRSLLPDIKEFKRKRGKAPRNSGLSGSPCRTREPGRMQQP
jgi:SAM-dependent methyltransferase